ncbi:MAG: hypothetical protein KME21_16045 [Desmonostoc vinosum HA7617-LM4]|jgi:hypothetical protein|nr:hypothetical protein [Desmonostoc vinosum HA7617-LM4]
MSNSVPPEDQTSRENEVTQINANNLDSSQPTHLQVDTFISNHSPSQAKPTEISQPVVVVEASKEAALDIWSVFKLIWKDPANGLQAALTTLGDNRAFNAGIILCVLFMLAFWMAVLKVVESIAALLTFGNLFGRGFNGQLGFSEHIRILIGAAIPVLSMIAVLWCIRQIFRAAGNYKQFTFVTGFSIAPLTLFLLLLWLLGINAGEITVLLYIFCFTTLILFLNTALIGVLRLSSRNALLLVPVLLIADYFITRVGFEILY